MPPNNSETSPGLQLPAPQPENLPAEPGSQQAERAPAAPETTPGRSAPAMPPANIPLPAYPAAAQPQAQNGGVTNTTTSTLKASDDTDLIEKEWVNKAKQIVERTRDDPYKQSEELTVVKADYIKKRYNKTIKLNK